MHAAVRRYFARRREVSLEESGEMPAVSAGDQEQAQALRAAMAELPERMRIALVMRVVEKRSIPEIAEALDASEKAISPLLYRAKKALRELLKGE